MSQTDNLEFEVGSLIRRAATIESNNQEDRTIELSFASEAMIDQGNYFEVLSHNQGDYDFTWLNSQNAPVLLEHDTDDHVGVVQRAWVDESTRKSRAVIKIGTDSESSEVWTKITDGILRNVSVGAVATGYRVDRTANPDKPIIYVQWVPQELSLCALPIDKQVGIARSVKNSDPVQAGSESLVNPSEIKSDEKPSDSLVTRSVTGEIKVVSDQIQSNNNKKDKTMTIEVENLNPEIIRAKNAEAISTMAKQFDATDLGIDFISRGASVQEFAEALKASRQTNHKVDTSVGLGLSEKETNQFSIARAMQAVSTGDFSDAGYELEISRAYAKQHGKAQKSTNIYIPDEVIFRAAGANATTTTTAGAAGLKNRGPWIEALRAKTIAGRLGVNMVGGLSGALELPKFLSLPQARKVTEGADGTVDAITAGVVTLVPQSIIALVELTRSMVNNLPSIESQLNAELIASIATKIDQEVFAAVLADTDVDFVTTPTAGVTYAEIRSLVTKLSNADVNTDAARFALNGTVEGYLSSTLKSDNTAALYLRGEDGRIAGLPSEFSRTVGGNHLLVADWSKVTVGAWGGIELASDTSTRFASGGTMLRAIADIDVGVTVPAAITGYLDLVV